MIDAVDLIAAQHLQNAMVQLQGAPQVVPERLLDHDPGPGAFRLAVYEVGSTKSFNDWFEEIGIGGKVEEAISGQACGFFDGMEVVGYLWHAIGLQQVGRLIEDACRELVPGI